MRDTSSAADWGKEEWEEEDTVDIEKCQIGTLGAEGAYRAVEAGRADIGDIAGTEGSFGSGPRVVGSAGAWPEDVYVEDVKLEEGQMGGCH